MHSSRSLRSAPAFRSRPAWQHQRPATLTAHIHHPITRRPHIGIRRHFTARPAYFSVAGSEATIMTVITMVISTANRIEPGNMSGTIGTPVMTRAKGAKAGQTPPVCGPACRSGMA
jgi:hypothetical protein